MPSVPLNIHDQNIPLRVEFYNALNVNIEEASMVLVRALKAGRASNDCPISLGEKIDALKEIFVKPHREEQFSRAFNQAVEYVVDDISSEAEKIVLNVQNVDAVCGGNHKGTKISRCN